MSPPNRYDVVWAAYFGGGIALDVWRSHQQDQSTLSSRARLRVGSRPGRVVFVGGWLTLTGWLLPHMLVKPVPRSVPVLSPPS